MKFLRSLVRRRFAGEPVVALRNVGHFQANRQSALKLSIHCFLEIFLRHNISLLSRHASEGVTKRILSKKVKQKKNLTT